MAICPRTGVAVPECCCPRCTEEMLRRFRPELFEGEIRITRTSGERSHRPRVPPEPST